MEPRRNLSILPSNAPALPLDTSDHPSTPHDFADATISGICQIFNQGFGCQVCNLDHICLLCKQDDHGAIECKSAVLQVRSDNIGLHTSESRNTDSKFAFHRGHEVRTSSFRINAPDHSAQAALHAERAKGQRRNLASRMRPYYWHTEWQTPRYRQYREKTRQKVSKYDSIWPDRVEEAFQIGLFPGKWTILHF